MKKPVLVIMAAGMGSRYGGLKQIDPVDEQGHIIMDFSIYDAAKAGFEKVIFIIKKENEKEFRERIAGRITGKMEAVCVCQSLDGLPEGYTVPEGRVKPWGTGHAVLSAACAIDGPFAVINADDYYGSHAFHVMYHFLSGLPETDCGRYAMVGYHLGNTLTDNGYVARGVCELDAEGYLRQITERVRIEKRADGPACTEDNGTTWIPLSPDTAVSMNLWGFEKGFLDELAKRFPRFLDRALAENPLKAEYFLPSVVSELLAEGKASVRVLPSSDKWYGVTYQEDKPVVVEAIRRMKAAGLYEGL